MAEKPADTNAQMAETETEAADALAELESAIAAGRSMGHGAWAIMNRVRHLLGVTGESGILSAEAGGTMTEVERLLEAVAWAQGLTLIPQDTEVREASLSYVKPDEYQRHINALLPQLARLLRARGGDDGAKADSVRLDWMEEHCVSAARGPSLRAAIDAAIAKTAPHPPTAGE